jgi:hypothetical protein
MPRGQQGFIELMVLLNAADKHPKGIFFTPLQCLKLNEEGLALSVRSFVFE